LKTLSQICFFLSTLLLVGCPASKPDRLPTNPDFAAAPKNIILLIGDGMGLTQISSHIHTKNKPSIFESFNYIGFQKTYATSDLVTDSAAAATAMACGQKTFNGAVGMSKDTLPIPSIMSKVQGQGFKTGLVVSSTIVHATPAAFYAHNTFRVRNEAIAKDLVKSDIDFLVGGGLKYFNRRADDADLLEELSNKGYYVNDYYSSEFENFRPKIDQKNIFFTADNQPLSAASGRTYMPLATKKALRYFDQQIDANGFLMMIEGSQIDWAGHSNDATMLRQELMDFEKCIAIAIEYAAAQKETLVIVTADHETGGLGLNKTKKANNFDPQFTTNGHTATLVPVFAYGPKAELFQGIYENTALFDKMKEAIGL